MAAGLTFAVAEMVPTPPFCILARRNDSLPTKTSKLISLSISISPPRRAPNVPSSFGFWILELPWDLELGVWDFELVWWRARTANASRKVLVLFQSPELSFIPALAFGYAARSRSTNLGVIPTTATGGMW